MKLYNKPAIEICSFDVKDIITVSTGITVSGVTRAEQLATYGDAVQSAYTNLNNAQSVAATDVTVFEW